jgi:hypothetical protein
MFIQFYLAMSQSVVPSLKYFVPENAYIDVEYGQDGYRRITYWANELGMKTRDNFPLGVDVYFDSTILVFYSRRVDSMYYSFSFWLDGSLNLINVSTNNLATIIYYWPGGGINYMGSYDLSMDFEEDSETGVHCEFDEDGLIISYKLYERGVLLKEINYR